MRDRVGALGSQWLPSPLTLSLSLCPPISPPCHWGSRADRVPKPRFLWQTSTPHTFTHPPLLPPPATHGSPHPGAARTDSHLSHKPTALRRTAPHPPSSTPLRPQRHAWLSPVPSHHTTPRLPRHAAPPPGTEGTTAPLTVPLQAWPPAAGPRPHHTARCSSMLCSGCYIYNRLHTAP